MLRLLKWVYRRGQLDMAHRISATLLHTATKPELAKLQKELIMDTVKMIKDTYIDERITVGVETKPEDAKHG